MGEAVRTDIGMMTGEEMDFFYIPVFIDGIQVYQVQSLLLTT